MSDFKHLYWEARKGRSSDISSYVEAVNTALDTNPTDYILNLEYIISSDVGLKTLKPFIERYGLPIAACNTTLQLLDECVKKCEMQKKDSSLYIEAIDYLESFKNKYHGAFDMFDYYNEGSNEKYIRTYYGTSNGTKNKLLLNGMLSAFGEVAIPDLIITADQSGHNAAAKLENAITSMPEVGDSMFCEWVDHACQGTICSPNVGFNKLSTIVADCLDRNQKVYREYVISGNDDAMLEYTDEDIDAIKKLISFKEFALTGMDASNVESIMEAQREIYDLYSELDGLITESGNMINFDEDAKSDFRSRIDRMFDTASKLSPDELKERSIGVNKMIADAQAKIKDLKKQESQIDPNKDKIKLNKIREDLAFYQSMVDSYFDTLKALNETTGDAGIVDFLPERSNLWIVNTRNKKTGESPSYIKHNHDMATWGEDDKEKKDDKEKTLDDYKRPSADEGPVSKPTKPEPEVEPYNDEEEQTPEEKQAEKQAIQNYYYYTYNNSLNKNSHSFNKTDDHSKHNKDDHSVRDSYNKYNDNDDDAVDKVYRSVESADNDSESPENFEEFLNSET